MLTDVALTAPDGATERLEETFKRLGVKAPSRNTPNSRRKAQARCRQMLYAGKGAMTGGSQGRQD